MAFRKPNNQALPNTFWSNPELLREATSIFGLPCSLDAKIGGCAHWTEGPLHHVEIQDHPKRATLTARSGLSRTKLSFMPLTTRQSARLLSVSSDRPSKALAGLTLAHVVDAGLITEKYAIDNNLWERWSSAAESKAGAKRLLLLLDYALQDGTKSWEDFASQ